jgi:hypothetical protein
MISARRVRLVVLAGLLSAALGCGPQRSDPVVIPADSQVKTAFVNDLGSSFVLESVEMKVDGRISGRYDVDAGSPEHEIEFSAAVVAAGDHEASVHAVYRGQGHGVFSYLKDYKFEVESSHDFRTPPLKTVEVTAVCYEKGGPTTALSDRPAIRWIEEVR